MKINNNDVKEYFNKTVGNLENDYQTYRWAKSPVKYYHHLQTKNCYQKVLSSVNVTNALEVGCGPCIWTKLISKYSTNVVAIDLSIEMLKQGKNKVSAQLCVANVDLLPFVSDSFNLLFTSRAFEYFPDKLNSLLEINRVLTIGGQIYIITKNPEYRGYGLSGTSVKKDLHSGNIAPEDTIRLLKKSGFEIGFISPVIIGRSKFRMIWALISFILYIYLPKYKYSLPGWLSPATESYLIHATKIKCLDQ